MSNSSSSSVHSDHVFKLYGFDRTISSSDVPISAQSSTSQHSGSNSSSSVIGGNSGVTVLNEGFLFKPPPQYPNNESVMLFTMNQPSTISDMTSSSSSVQSVSLYASPLPSLPTRSKHTHILTLVLTLTSSPLFIYTCNISESSLQELKTTQHLQVDMPGQPAYQYALFSHIFNAKEGNDKKHSFQCHLELSNISTVATGDDDNYGDNEEDEQEIAQKTGILRIIEITPYKHIEHLCLNVSLPSALTRCNYLRELTASQYDRGKALLTALDQEKKKNIALQDEMNELESTNEQLTQHVTDEKERLYREYEKKVVEMTVNMDKLHSKSLSSIAEVKTEYDMKLLNQKEIQQNLESKLVEREQELAKLRNELIQCKHEKASTENQFMLMQNDNKLVKGKFEELVSQMGLWKEQQEENSRVIIHLKDQCEQSKLENTRLKENGNKDLVEKAKLAELLGVLRGNVQQSEAQLAESVGETQKGNELIGCLQKEKLAQLKKNDKYKALCSELKEKVNAREAQLRDIQFTWEKLRLQFDDLQGKYTTAHSKMQLLEQAQGDFDRTLGEKDKLILWLNKEVEHLKDNNTSSMKLRNSTSVTTPFSPLPGTMPNNIGPHTHMITSKISAPKDFPSLTPNLSPMHHNLSGFSIPVHHLQQLSPQHNVTSFNSPMQPSNIFHSPMIGANTRIENVPTPKHSVNTPQKQLPVLPTPTIQQTPQPTRDLLNESNTVSNDTLVPTPKPTLQRQPKPTTKSTPEQEAHKSFLATLAKLTGLPS